MPIRQILEQVKTLRPRDRKELAKRLIAMSEVPQEGCQPKTAADIVAMLEATNDPIALGDPHREDPIEWVKRIREDQLRQRLGDWGQDE